MKGKWAAFAPLIFALCLTSRGVYGQSATSGEDLFGDLVGIIMESEEEEDSVVYEVPESLSEIIREFYAEEIIDESVPKDVLAYLENAYSEHGYYEAGDWSPKDFIYQYHPREDELPEFDKSEFELPVVGTLSSGFGYRPRFRRLHQGIDITLFEGEAVKCALPGVVTLVGYDRGGYGNYVVVAHSDGMETRYAHLSNVLAAPGDSLEAGEILGLGGNTGNSTGPHLHFELRYRGVAVNPLLWFDLSALP